MKNKNTTPTNEAMLEREKVGAITAMARNQKASGKPELPPIAIAQLERNKAWIDLEKAQASAEALAEALREFIKRASISLDQSATHHGIANCEAIAKARAALAAWEAGQ